VLHQLPPSGFHDVQTPSLILDLDRVRHSYETLRRGFAGLRPQVFYSVKANGDPRLLAALDEAGSGFDVASVQEIRELRELGVPTSRITFSATVKVPDHVAEAHALGIDRFAFDGESEIVKLARHAPYERARPAVGAPTTALVAR